MSQRMIVLDGDSILKLLTHFSTGDVPLDAELRGLGFSPVLRHWLGLKVRSAQWRDDPDPTLGGEYAPLHIRYQANKIMRWGDKHVDPVWSDDVEAPKRH